MQNQRAEFSESLQADGNLAAAAQGLSQQTFDLWKDEFVATAQKVFAKSDANRDGKLTQLEINNAVENDQSIKGREAQVLAAMTYMSSEYKSLSQRQFLNLAKEVEGDKYARRYLERTAQSQQYTGDLFAQKFYPALSVRPEDIKQGFTGTCEFMAPLASLAQQRPHAIVQMLKENSDGTYSVKFPLLKEEVVVSKPTEAERGLYAQGSVDGIWPSVLEKAYRKHYGQKSDGDVSRWHGGFQTTTGIVPSVVAISSDRLESGYSDDYVHEILTKAMQSNAVIEVGRLEQNHSSTQLEEGDDRGLPTDHAYSLLKYDPEKRLVTIRNPWGRIEPQDADGKPKDGKDDGIFVMSLSQIRKNFDRLIME